MKILGLGVPELAIILVVVLLIFGPKNLPKLGAAVGKGIKGIRDGISGGKSDEVVETEEAVIERVEKLEAASVEEEAKPTVKRVVKKKVAAE